MYTAALKSFEIRFAKFKDDAFLMAASFLSGHGLKFICKSQNNKIFKSDGDSFQETVKEYIRSNVGIISDVPPSTPPYSSSQEDTPAPPQKKLLMLMISSVMRRISLQLALILHVGSMSLRITVLP